MSSLTRQVRNSFNSALLTVPTGVIEFTSPGSPTLGLVNYLDLLRRILVLCVRAEVDGAVALDFYSQECPSDPEQLEYTEAAKHIRTVKEYGYSRRHEIEKAGGALCASMCEVIAGHQWLRSATRVLPVPGHDQAAPASASVRIGHTLRTMLSLDLTTVGTRSEFRLSAKEMTEADRALLADEFMIDDDLSGKPC